MDKLAKKIRKEIILNNKRNTWKVTENLTYSDSAAVKKSTVTLAKKTETFEDLWDDDNWFTTAMGNTVNHTVTTTIPGYGKVYGNSVFIIRDNLTNLELKKDQSTYII